MTHSASLGRRAALAGLPLALLARPARAGLVNRMPVREAGLVATLFLPAKDMGLPAVVSLTGAGGGLWEPPARALAAEGFPTLALATHNAEGRPARLARLPLEYVETAVAWLRHTVRPRRDFVALRGWSRGAEMALLFASLSPSVNAVLAYAPRCYAGREQDRPNAFDAPDAVAAFTWRGQDVVGSPLPPAQRPAPDRQGYEDWFGTPVERIAGPILLVSGQADTGLGGTTAERGCAYAMHRLALAGFPYRHSHLSYPDAGHDIGGPPPYAGTAVGGGTPAGNAAAIADSWPRSLAFLREAAG